jgi:hypothetical protein
MAATKGRGLTAAIALLAWNSCLGAQGELRTVHGIVTDGRNQPVDHAAVQIENDSTLLVRSYITQRDGKYHFVGLNPDINYKLSAEFDGIRSRSRTLSKFDSNRSRQMDLAIHFSK